MARSMTAFARHCGHGPWGRAVWELRAVNHRYLEIMLHLPEDLRGLETAVRERIHAVLGRGKIDCNLRFEPCAAHGGALTVDRELAASVSDAAREVAALAGCDGAFSPLDLLRWPGVLSCPAPDLKILVVPLLEALDEALAELIATREREGAKLAQCILDRCDLAEQEACKLRARVPEFCAAVRARLLARVQDLGRELGGEVDETRLAQEMVMVAQKMDVAEELDRLDAHLGELRRVLASDLPIGRRMDFLIQELNREANTLGAKSAHLKMSFSSVELKVLFEQMREQIQNIE